MDIKQTGWVSVVDSYSSEWGRMLGSYEQGMTNEPSDFVRSACVSKRGGRG